MDPGTTVLLVVAVAGIRATALAVGLAALVYANSTTSADNLPDYFFPRGLRDPVAFACVGTMHNFSYLGGFLGILTGSAYLVVRRLLTPPPAAPPGPAAGKETLAPRPPGGVS